MGYYFPKAKTTADLSPEQNERYKVIRSKGSDLPPPLLARFEAVKERIGPVTSGEIMAALEELWQDAVVCWILSGENSGIDWVDPEFAEDERTEEERQRDREAWEEIVRRWKERDERRKREYDERERNERPLLYSIRKFFSKFLKSN